MPDTRLVFTEILRAVPRGEFTPAVIRELRGGRWRRVDKERNPRDWAKLFHATTPVVFDINDGHEGGAAITGLIPSAADAARRVDVLAPGPGMRVAEIGTDSGWVAAVLQHIVQKGNVVSVADTTRLALIAEGNLARHPNIQVVCGPDIGVLAPAASYDGLISHRAVARVPWTWINCVRPGGRLCVALQTRMNSESLLLGLAVAHDGRSASGRFYSTPSPQVVWLRSQRPVPASSIDAREAPRVSSTPTDSTHHLQAGAQLLAGLLHPDIHMDLVRSSDPLDGEVADRLRLRDEQVSRAVVFLRGRENVFAWGPRDLNARLAQCFSQWRRLGTPAPEHFGLTVTETSHTLWCGSPDGPSWVLPSLPTSYRETT